MASTKKAKISKLSKFLDKHSAAYYSGNPTISDAEFDEAWYELKSLDPTNPSLDSIGEAEGESIPGHDGSHQVLRHCGRDRAGLSGHMGYLERPVIGLGIGQGEKR